MRLRSRVSRMPRARVTTGSPPWCPGVELVTPTTALTQAVLVPGNGLPLGMPITRQPAFRGRSRERQTLDGALERVRGGESAVLVLRGEAGIGKTELMRYCARQASGCRVIQIAGVESEMQLAFAALHQLCGPMMGALN